MAGASPARNSIVVISHDIVDVQMAGPGIRYLELATVLAREFKVTLATPNPCRLQSEVRIHPYHDWPSLEAACAGAQVIIATGFTLHQFPRLGWLEIPFAMDLYDPFPLENLSLFAQRPLAEQQASFDFSMGVLDAICEAGDFFVCANARQRDWWLGILQAYGRVNPYTMAEDAGLRSLVDEVPFGLPSGPFEAHGLGPKATLPELGPDARLILWGGGIWDWLDPLTLIQAMPAILEREPRARLLFPGSRHPNPGMVEMQMQRRALELAEQLGLLDRAVFFGDWVPYEEWPAYLADADVAVSLHFDTLETRFAAVRSRTLGCIWAGLPVVVTEGDAASELVEQHGLGSVVGYGDVAGVAEAVLHVLAAGKEPYRPGFEQVAPRLTWEQVAQPLFAFCRAPRRAPDKAIPIRFTSSLYRESLATLAEQQRETERLQGVVQAYEQGRFMRAMRQVDELKQKWQSLR